MFYLIANWKAQITSEEAINWLKIFKEEYIPSDHVSIIICPPSIQLGVVAAYLESVNNVFLGVQDISKFSKGAFTGEMPVELLPPYVKYGIVGHAERRQYFNESDSDIAEKTKRLSEHSIKPIVCVRSSEDKVPAQSYLVAYEPESSIGTNLVATVDEAIEMKQKLNLTSEQLFVYGGNVNKDTAHDFVKSNEVSGFLVGRASLNPREFLSIASKCSV